MVRKALNTFAVDNYGHRYAVYVDFEERNAWQTRDPETGKMVHATCNKWVLKIQDTPGHWYMSDLVCGSNSGMIYLDYGQGWYVTNFGDVLREAKELI